MKILVANWRCIKNPEMGGAEIHFHEIFKLIVNDHPYIFLYIPNSITAVNKKIKNVSPSIIGIMHNEIDWIKP
jgi:hypothetical protein